MNHLYIRHTVGGRLFLDSKLHDLLYDLQEEDHDWRFTIDLKDETMALQILQHRHELNIFVVKEGQTAVKSWYYSQRGDVVYDKEKHKLTIQADHRIDYPI